MFYPSFDLEQLISSDYAVYVQKVFFVMCGSTVLFSAASDLCLFLICGLYHLSFGLLALLRRYEQGCIPMLGPPKVVYRLDYHVFS